MERKGPPKGAKSEPGGAKREPKRNQKGASGAEGNQKGAKSETKGTRREPKGDQNASKSRFSVKVVKIMEKGSTTGSHDIPVCESFSF